MGNPIRSLAARTLPAALKEPLRRWSRSLMPAQRWQLAREWMRGYSLPGARRWQTDASLLSQWDIKMGLVNYQWRGVRMLKHPIEVALYPLLFWHAKPRTIFEIGSASGGSAIFFSDILAGQGAACRILSVDVAVPAPPITPANVEFLAGDAGNLGKTLTAARLAECPRPWLVIEDSSHQYAHTLAVLRFFDPMMAVGEYLVVEDGNVTHMGEAARFDGGPTRAIEEFLRETAGRYEIDHEYCDRFGHNFTGNPNGYLRRIA